MNSNDKRKKATVCVLTLACVALMVATSMACVVNNDNGTSIDSRTDLIIGKENPPGQDPVTEKEDVITDNGKTFWNGLIKYRVKTDTTCKAVNYNGSDRHPIIPDIACKEGHKYIVDEIGECAFDKCFGRALYSVEIGPYVKTISYHAMDGQGDHDHGFRFTIRDLEHSQLSYIGEKAFFHTNIRSIELPASLTLIDDSAFEGCYQVKKVVLHSKSLQIKHRAFFKCVNLENINLENVNRIGSDAFCDCGKLEDVNLSSAWDIREYAFDGTNLKHITFAKNIAILEDKAFPGMCFSDFNNNILVKNPSNLAGKEFRKDIDNWYHQIR